MGKIYVCPFCGLERSQKKQMDFHIKYGHSEIFEFLRKEQTREDVEKKLAELEEKKHLLDKEIREMKAIIDLKLVDESEHE